MRNWTSLLAALALAGCASTSANDSKPLVSLSTPAEAIPLEDQQVLFWDDATRSARFRAMERYFAGIEVTPDADYRELLAGDPLPAEVDAAADAYMAATGAAGLMVLQDGRKRYENYALGFGPEQRWTSFSVAKSFTSTLLGAAIRDGFIASLDDPVTRYLPGLAGTAYDGVTVGQIATMTSGVKWNEDYTDPASDVARMLAIAPVAGESQAVTYAKTLTREAAAGEKWVYKTLETNLLGLIVEKATSRSLAAYAATEIVEPAGFEGGLFWMTDLTGGNIGGCCLSLRLGDYARFGQFVLERGEGVVPQGWFDRAGAPQVDFENGGFGYGYQWWAYPGGSYGAQGIFGQAVTVVPDEGLVIAVVSNWPTATSADNRRALLSLVRKIAGSDSD